MLLFLSDGAPLLSLLVLGRTNEDAVLFLKALSVEFSLEVILLVFLSFFLFSNGFFLVDALVVTGAIFLSHSSY